MNTLSHNIIARVILTIPFHEEKQNEIEKPDFIKMH